MLINAMEEFNKFNEEKIVVDIELKNGEKYHAAHVMLDSVAEGSDRVVIKEQGVGHALEIIPFTEIQRITIYDQE